MLSVSCSGTKVKNQSTFPLQSREARGLLRAGRQLFKLSPKLCLHWWEVEQESAEMGGQDLGHWAQNGDVLGRGSLLCSLSWD